MARRPKQLSFDDRPRWGGKRRGAGRPRVAIRRQVAHRSRAPFERRSPLHVTLRMAPHVYALRSRRSLRVMQRALLGGGHRFDVRVVQTSVQGNHVHLLVEAPDQLALSRAMKGLAVRIARGLNQMMHMSGRVLGDRYHVRQLRSPSEVRSVMHYIRYNHQHHGLSSSVVDEYSSDGLLSGILPPATLWVLTVGWRRGRIGKLPEEPGS